VRITAPPTLAGSGTELSAVRFQIANRPRGITLRETVVDASGVSLTLAADRNIAYEGDTAYVIVEASAEPKADDDKMRGVPGRVSLGVLPAIPFEIVQE
jgi:hypothetical protein